MKFSFSNIYTFFIYFKLKKCNLSDVKTHEGTDVEISFDYIHLYST